MIKDFLYAQPDARIIHAVNAIILLLKRGWIFFSKKTGESKNAKQALLKGGLLFHDPPYYSSDDQ